MIVNPPVQHFVISSPIEGRLVDQGKPLANTKLIRKLEWNGDKEGTKEDIVITDENGMFNFDVFELDMAMRGLEQFVAKTTILLQKGDEEILLWYTPKQFKELFSELGSMPKGLICDLSNSEIATLNSTTARSRILTICRWDNMPEFVEA